MRGLPPSYAREFCGLKDIWLTAPKFTLFKGYCPAYICSMFDSINTYIAKCVPVTKEELEYVDDILEYKKVSKKTTRLHESEVCNFEAHIIKGCICTYYIDEKGIKAALQFANRNGIRKICRGHLKAATLNQYHLFISFSVICARK